MLKDTDEAERGTGQPTKTRGELLKEKALHLFGKTYIALPTLVAVLLFVGTSAFYFAEYTRVNPLEKDLFQKDREVESSRKAIEELESEKTLLTAELEQLRLESREANTERPIPISPVRKKAVIGRVVKFHWAYKPKTEFSNYVLEIQPTGLENGEPLRYQVPDPVRRTLYFELDPKWIGQIFWRVRPGGLADGAEQRELWSYYGSFVVYRSIIHRIKTTRKLIVGTTPAFLSYDHPIDDKRGRPDSFDMDLVEWIVEQLREKLLVLDLQIELRNIPWEHLLENVRAHEVDLAVGTITKSKQRERAFPGLKFSQGYLQNHQMLIRSKYANPLRGKSMHEGDFLAGLRGKRVGVQNHTINEKAARSLSRKYKFEVEDKYASYVDVYDALRNGEIDYGMIDSVRHEMVGNQEFQPVGRYLDVYLRDFYIKELGQPVEEYAIAVAEDHRSPRSLLKLVNEILDSPESKGKEGKLEELKKKFFGRVEE